MTNSAKKCLHPQEECIAFSLMTDKYLYVKHLYVKTRYTRSFTNVPRHHQINIMLINVTECYIETYRLRSSEIGHFALLSSDIDKKAKAYSAVSDCFAFLSNLTEIEVREPREMRQVANKLVKLYSSDLDDTLGNGLI